MINNSNPFNKLKLPELDGLHTLFFGTDNAKLRDTNTTTFSLPAGFTCPGAKDCLAWFDREKRKLQDGPDAEFRCFAASMEAAFPSVSQSVDKNLAILKRANTVKAMTEIIDMSLPAKKYENIRIHVDGDYFSLSYFKAWLNVAKANPNRVFYGYTKSLPFWIKMRDQMPSNFVLTASMGGKWDHLIEANGLRKATVVYHPDVAAFMGLEIDHDDSHARSPYGGDFALLIHGTQQSGGEAAKAIKRLKSEGVKYSYSNKK
jgi:hypothetical protein